MQIAMRIFRLNKKEEEITSVKVEMQKNINATVRSINKLNTKLKKGDVSINIAKAIGYTIKCNGNNC